MRPDYCTSTIQTFCFPYPLFDAVLTFGTRKVLWKRHSKKFTFRPVGGITALYDCLTCGHQSDRCRRMTTRETAYMLPADETEQVLYIRVVVALGSAGPD